MLKNMYKDKTIVLLRFVMKLQLASKVQHNLRCVFTKYIYIIEYGKGELVKLMCMCMYSNGIGGRGCAGGRRGGHTVKGG